MKTFKVSEIWQVGFRIYFGDDFVSIAPFEQDAYSFFSRHRNDPTFGSTAHDYCKRIDKIYTQKEDSLIKLKEELEESKEFKNVEFQQVSSAIGLPKILTYTHIQTGIKTEFDGVIFVSEKKISDEEFQVEDAQEFIKKQGKIYIDTAQIGSKKTLAEDRFFYKMSAHCEWMYITNSADFSTNRFRSEIDPEQIIFSLSLIDDKMIHFTMPQQTIETGEKYNLLIGDKNHIVQVIAHDFEVYRYLNFLEERLKLIRDELLKIQGNLFNDVPLLPWSIKLMIPFTWSKAINYSTHLQRSLEKIVRYRLYLPIFGEVVSAYEEYEKKGVGFYNLPSPFLTEENKFSVSQYQTFSPAPLEINSDGIEIKGNIQSLRTFAGYPSRLIDFITTIQNLSNETFELLQSLTVTPALQTGMLAAVISLLAMLISIIAFVFSPIIGNLYNLPQEQEIPKAIKPQMSPDQKSKFVSPTPTPKVNFSPRQKEVAKPKQNPSPTTPSPKITSKEQSKLPSTESDQRKL